MITIRFDIAFRLYARATGAVGAVVAAFDDDELSLMEDGTLKFSRIPTFNMLVYGGTST